MQKIEHPSELEIGKSYWLKKKAGHYAGKFEAARLRQAGGEPYFLNWIWASDENPQAFERWEIYGPIPEPAADA